jgi:hypothetical protein
MALNLLNSYFISAFSATSCFTRFSVCMLYKANSSIFFNNKASICCMSMPSSTTSQEEGMYLSAQCPGVEALRRSNPNAIDGELHHFNPHRFRIASLPKPRSQ